MAGLVHGSGFANLNCLGRLIDLIFSGYRFLLPWHANRVARYCGRTTVQRGIAYANMMNLLDIYTALARERPDEPALIFEREPHVGIRLSWAQLAARGEELSLRLAAAGISRQSLCAVELADHPDTLPLLLGIWHLAGTALLVDPKWGDSVRRSIYSHSRPDASITVDPEFTVSFLKRRTFRSAG